MKIFKNIKILKYLLNIEEHYVVRIEIFCKNVANIENQIELQRKKVGGCEKDSKKRNEMFRFNIKSFYHFY